MVSVSMDGAGPRLSHDESSLERKPGTEMPSERRARRARDGGDSSSWDETHMESQRRAVRRISGGRAGRTSTSDAGCPVEIWRLSALSSWLRCGRSVALALLRALLAVPCHARGARGKRRATERPSAIREREREVERGRGGEREGGSLAELQWRPSLLSSLKSSCFPRMQADSRRSSLAGAGSTSLSLGRGWALPARTRACARAQVTRRPSGPTPRRSSFR